MLDQYRRSYLTWCAELKRRKDIDLPNNVSVRLKTTGRTTKQPSPGLVSKRTCWTSLGCVVFILQYHSDSLCFCFVLDKRASLSVIPTAEFLVGLLAKVDFIGSITDIADNDSRSLALNCRINYCPAHFVFNVAHHSLVLGAHSRASTNKSLITATTFAVARERAAEFRHALSVPLLLMAAFTASDDRCFSFVANYGRMNLAQVYAYCIIACWLLGLLAIFYNDMPGVASGFTVHNKAHFHNPQDVAQMIGKLDLNWFAIAPVGQANNPIGQFNSSILPDSSAPSLIAIGELGINSRLAQAADGRAGPVESLLSSINAVGMKRQLSSGKAQVTYSRHRAFRQPQSLTLDQLPVSADDVAVDVATGAVEIVSSCSIKLAFDNVSSNHNILFISHKWLKPKKKTTPYRSL